MPFPKFTATGDLPIGIHAASLAETLVHFGIGFPRRRILSLRLERVYKIAFRTGSLARFVVFGSYITSKDEPNDVDVFMIMDDNFDVAVLRGESQLLFDHSAAQIHFGCSVFWVRRLAALGGEQVSIEHWQLKRDGTHRGIVEILSE